MDGAEREGEEWEGGGGGVLQAFLRHTGIAEREKHCDLLPLSRMKYSGVSRMPGIFPDSSASKSPGLVTPGDRTKERQRTDN